MKKILSAMLLMGLLVACGGGNTGGGNTGGNNAPSAPNTVTGLVTDIGSGARLKDVKVSVVGGSQTVTTDERGEFILKNLPLGLVKLDLEKAGYAPGHAIAESTSSAQAAVVALKKDGAEQSYNPTQARTLFERTEAGPYAVIFQPNSLNTTDTNLRVVVTPLDPTKEDTALPGDLIAGGASPTPLGAVTFAEFSILDSQNRRINLKPGSNAIVELPIPPELRSRYKIGDKIHCYAYNPQTGKWEDFVEGTVERSSVDGTTPVLKASIRHFSWYGGAPAVQDQECVDIEVRGRDGPLEGAVVTARPGLRTVTGKYGQASITVEKGANVTYTATKTYTDTFVDSRGNLVPKPGAKVIDIGKVYEDDLIGLDGKNYSRRPGPCPGGSGQSVRAAAGENPLQIRVAPAPEGFYEANAILQPGGAAFVQLEKGIPTADGDLDNAEAAGGAKITISDNAGKSATLSEVAAGSYFANNFDIQPGRRYTLNIDADGNGSIDGSGSAFALGNVAWSNLSNGGSYSAASLTASWTDTASSQPGYNALYLVSFQRQGGSGAADFATYTGSERSFQPRAQTSSPPTPLAPGSYTVSLNAFSGAFSGGNLNISDNITGIGMQGKIFSLQAVSPITITLTP